METCSQVSDVAAFVIAPKRTSRRASPPAFLSTHGQRTTQRLNLGCQRNPPWQTTAAGATTIGAAGTTTTGPLLGRHPPYGPRWKPGPQPPSALALSRER